MSRKGINEKRKVTKRFCDGTSTSHGFGGGLLVRSSTISGSCPTTYEASIFVAPLIASPGLSTARIN